MKPPEVEKIWELNADNFSLHVEERSAGVTGIDGNVSLDEGNKLLVGKVAAFSGDNSCRDGIVQSEGAPMAATHSPTLTFSDFPSFTTGRSFPSILMTAISVLGSVPRTLALNSRLSVR